MPKRTKKITAIVLVMAITMSLFAGCGGKNESYRTIAVTEANGTTTITREGKETFEAYEGVHLLSGDDARVNPAADMTLELDNDKHVFADENTHFYITADGKEGSTKSVINLDEGSVLIRIDNKLGAEETFEVNTPNSTMSVRGTVFRVAVNPVGDGQIETAVQTFEGNVYVAIKDENDQVSEAGIEVAAGEQTQIITVDGATEFSEVEPAVITDLSDRAKEKLQEFADLGASIVYSEVDEYELMKELNAHWVEVSSYYEEYSDQYELNDQGLILSMGYENGYREAYEYGDNNELLYREITDVNYEGVERKSYFVYNPDGTIAQEVSATGFDTRYSYYADGTLKREEVFVNLRQSDYYDSENYPDEWQYFESRDYNEHGDLIHEETYLNLYDFINNPKLYTDDYSYDYDSEGRLICKRGEEYTIYYEYDEHGNLVYAYKISNETGEKAYSDEESYVYEYVDGRIKSASFVRTYVEKGNYYSEGEDNYDDHGRKISGYLTSMSVDDNGEQWEDGWADHFEYEYEYDEYGNLTYSMNRFYEDGMEPMDEITYYSYDKPEFPKGKLGDLFTRKVTITQVYGDEEYVNTRIEIYRYR